MSSFIRAYIGQRQEQESHFVTGPKNELLQPAFISYNDQPLYVSKQTPEETILGRYSEELYQPPATLTLTPSNDFDIQHIQVGWFEERIMRRHAYHLELEHVKQVPSNEYFALFSDQPSRAGEYAQVMQEQEVDDKLLMSYAQLLLRETSDWARLRTNTQTLIDRLK